MQEKVMGTLGKSWGMTVGEVAQRLGVKPTTTIRCILETLAFCGVLDRRVEYSDSGRLAWRYYIND